MTRSAGPVRPRGRRRRHLRARPCAGGGAARPQGGGDRARRAGQRRLDPQFRLRHRHRPAARRVLAAGHALARRLGRGGAGGRHPRRASRPCRGGAPAGGGGRAGGVPGHRDGRGLRAARRRARRSRASRCWRADGPARRCCAARTSCGSNRARRSRPWPAGWPRRRRHVPATRRCVHVGRPADASRPPAARLRPSAASSAPATISSRLFPDRFAAYGLTRCKLHMLRLLPRPALPRFTAAVMSDLGLVRYLGYAELPEAAALQARGSRRSSPSIWPTAST